MIVYFISFSGNNAKAWNKVWEHSTEHGIVRSPVSCRTLNNDGIVTASFWVHPGIVNNNDKPRMKFIEVDDNGAGVYLTEKNFDWGIQGAVGRIELHKIIPNPSEENYLLLGTAHNPSNLNQVSSFIAVLDNAVNVTSIYTLPTYQYWDIAVSPYNNFIVLCGFNKADTLLGCWSRKSILTVFDQTFSCMCVKSMTSQVGVGNCNRFDIAKCLTTWYDANEEKEYVAVAGNTTWDSAFGGLYSWGPVSIKTPKTYVALSELSNSGILTMNWIRWLDYWNREYNQMIPTDIMIDESNSRLNIVGTNAEGTSIGLNFSSIWSLGTNGNPIFNSQFEGNPSSLLYTHDLFVQQITLKATGKYLLSGWSPEYYYTGGIVDGKYNYFVAEFDTSDNTAGNIYNFIGKTSTYAGVNPSGYYGVNANINYVIWAGVPVPGFQTVKINQFHDYTSLVSWRDDNNDDQFAFSWLNFKSTSVPYEEQLRIKSSVSGGSDNDDYCYGIQHEWGLNGGTPRQQTPPGNPNWDTESNINTVIVSLRSPAARIPSSQDCDGDYD